MRLKLQAQSILNKFYLSVTVIICINLIHNKTLQKYIGTKTPTFPSLLRRFPAAVETLVTATWRPDGGKNWEAETLIFPYYSCSIPVTRMK